MTLSVFRAKERIETTEAPLHREKTRESITEKLQLISSFVVSSLPVLSLCSLFRCVTSSSSVLYFAWRGGTTMVAPPPGMSHRWFSSVARTATRFRLSVENSPRLAFKAAPRDFLLLGLGLAGNGRNTYHPCPSVRSQSPLSL